MFNFIETRLFTRLVSEYLSDEDYGNLQLEIINNPDAGVVIRGSGVDRKLKMNEQRDIGAEILNGIREIKRGDSGRVFTLPDVKEIRKKTGLSQSKFATLLGVSVRTLQDWEQGRRAPTGAARTLLLIAHKNPGALLDVA